MKSPQSKCKLPLISLSKKCGTLKVNSLHSLKDKIVPSSESYSNLSSYSVILNRPISHKLKNRKWSMQSESTANSLSKPKSSEIEDVYECENELNISNLSDFNCKWVIKAEGEEVLSGELGGIALAELVEEVGGVFGVVGAFPRTGVG